VASAWSTFLGAAAAAKTSGNGERERVARDRATALGQRLSHIVIQVANDTMPGLEIQRDGARVGKAQWGTPIPADPGPHRVLASAPGRKVWETVVTLPRAAETQTVSVPELEPAAPAQEQRRAPADEAGGLGAQRVGALVAGGVGVAGLVVGSVFGLISKSKHDEASPFCDGATCSNQRGVDLRSEALSAGNVSTVAFITGAVGLAAGAALWITAPPDTPRSTTAQLGVGPGSVVLRGTW
jgi:serine/threonine-protein kinase